LVGYEVVALKTSTIMTGQAILLGPEDGTVTIMCHRIFHGACAAGPESNEFCHGTCMAGLQSVPPLHVCVA